MIVKYPTLQSGFLGYPSEKLIQRPQIEPLSPVAILTQPKITRRNQEFFYSPAVETLCFDLINDPTLSTSIGYHSRVYEIFGVLFDKSGIFNFMKIQEENKNMSLEHKMFLEDTLGFVILGRERIQLPIYWNTVVSASNPSSNKPYVASVTTSVLGVRPPDDLTEFLHTWYKRGNITDMVLSLQVIFGRRSLHASYGAAKY